MSLYRVPLQMYVDVEAPSADQADQQAMQQLAGLVSQQSVEPLFHVHAGHCAPVAIETPDAQGQEQPHRRRGSPLVRLLFLLALLGGAFEIAVRLPFTHALLAGSPLALKTYLQHWLAGQETRTYRALGFIPVYWMGRLGKFLEFTSALAIIFDLYTEQQFRHGKQEVITGLRVGVQVGTLLHDLSFMRWISPVGTGLGWLLLQMFDGLRRYLETGDIKFEKIERTGKRGSLYVLLLGFALDFFS